MKQFILTTSAIALLVAALPAQRGDRSATWKHLQSQYDTNGDAKISAEEHARGERVFGNLDRDGDGFITEADFKSRGRGHGGNDRPDRSDAERDAEVARTLGDMYGSFLNRDGKPGLANAEWQKMITKLEPSKEGVIAEASLKNLLGRDGQTRMAGMMGDRLVRALDRDEDGEITVDDLNAVFAALDKNSDGLIEQGDEIDMPPGKGEMAPDFTLPFADDQTKTVTLSSFRGDKPVALIFGSYT